MRHFFSLFSNLCYDMYSHIKRKNSKIRFSLNAAATKEFNRQVYILYQTSNIHLQGRTEGGLGGRGVVFSGMITNRTIFHYKYIIMKCLTKETKFP